VKRASIRPLSGLFHHRLVWFALLANFLLHLGWRGLQTACLVVRANFHLPLGLQVANCAAPENIYHHWEIMQHQIACLVLRASTLLSLVPVHVMSVSKASIQVSLVPAR